MIEGNWIAEGMLNQDDPFSDEYPTTIYHRSGELGDDTDTAEPSTKQLLGPDEPRSTDSMLTASTRQPRRNGVWKMVRSYCLIASLLAVLLILIIRRVVRDDDDVSRSIVLNQNSSVPTLAPVTLDLTSTQQPVAATLSTAVPTLGPTPTLQESIQPVKTQDTTTRLTPSPSTTAPTDSTPVPTTNMDVTSALAPTSGPTYSTTDEPTRQPILTDEPTISETDKGTSVPTDAPTSMTQSETDEPTVFVDEEDVESNPPSLPPSDLPSEYPSTMLSNLPSNFPSSLHSNNPSNPPSTTPTFLPSALPTSSPSLLPTTRELWGQSSYIANSNGDFGRSVAIRGNIMAVGMPGFDSVVIFARNETLAWNIQAIVSADSIPQNFGIDVALDHSEGTLVVGANSDDAGSAYVFTHSSNQNGEVEWIRQAKLSPSDGEIGDHFGTKVAICDDKILVGSPLDDNRRGTDSGSAYVFVRASNVFADTPLWSQQAKLIAGDGEYRDVFGLAVAIDGDTAVVGARLKDGVNEVDAGSVYVFSHSEDGAWTQETKLTAGSAEGFQAIFGASVGVSGDTIAVGSPFVSHNASEPGSVFIFERLDDATWAQEAVLSVEGGENNFGDSLALQGDTLVVGSSSGKAAFVYGRVFEETTTWILEAQLAASDVKNDARFGYRVGLDGEAVAVTAYNYEQGSLYVFERTSRNVPARTDEEFPDTCSAQAPSSVCKTDVDCCSGVCIINQCGGVDCAFGICA